MSLDDIKNKYISDISNMNSYVQYLENFFLSALLINENMSNVSPTLYAAPAIQTIQEQYPIIYEEMCQYRELQQDILNQIKVEVSSPHPDAATPDGELILAMYLEILKGNKNRKELVNTAREIIEALCITKGDLIGGERFHQIYDNNDILEHLVDLAINLEAIRHKNSLELNISYADNSIKALKLFDLNDSLNIYRQSFIQTMAFFDSCIFDIAEECMNKDFFTWLASFENTNIKTHDLAKTGSFKNFQTEHIHGLLKKCYVKDLIGIIHAMNNQYFIMDNTDEFAGIREAINRRNVHIHNNGYADRAYTELFNIYNFVVGDYLIIDNNYLVNTHRITKTLVTAIESNN